MKGRSKRMALRAAFAALLAALIAAGSTSERRAALKDFIVLGLGLGVERPLFDSDQVP